MNVALVHDWLTGMRGGESCLEVFCELFPDADLFTLLHVPGSVTPVIERRRVITSFIQRLPHATRAYRRYLPLFPAAVSRFDLRGYELILSSSHAVAKSVRVPPVAAALRRWDRRTAAGVRHFVAISRFVADRIRRAYGREADVIYPPVDVARFRIEESAGDYYLVVSALTPYKRLDLAVEAANQLGRRLLVVGTGPEARRLRALAGSNVEFLGWREDAQVADLYARCRALIFPTAEDFGITPLEAIASGRPVIALGQGGALETVVPPGGTDPPTGLFFARQTVDDLIGAIRALEQDPGRFEPKALRRRAEAFDRPIFKERVKGYLDARLARHSRC